MGMYQELHCTALPLIKSRLRVTVSRLHVRHLLLASRRLALFQMITDVSDLSFDFLLCLVLSYLIEMPHPMYCLYIGEGYCRWTLFSHSQPRL